MASVPIRKLTIADGMILIAATAVGIALSKSLDPIGWGWMWIFSVAWATPLFACWTAAILALRLRPPRLPFRRLLRQPGTPPAIMVLVFLPIWTVVMALHIRSNDFPLWEWGFASVPIGSSILGSWMIAFFTRTSRPESSWIDRLGRFIGICWILDMIFSIYLIYYVL